jgi:D-alanyl-D-alanine carboxypeptidase
MRELRVPGAIVLVRIPGEGRWVTALGVSDLDTRAPVTSDMHTRIGSITKSLTATIVLQLVDRGLVGLDDPVADHVRGVPNGRRITVRDLLGMRSGLFNTTEDVALNAALDADPFRVWHARELLPYSFSHPPMFEPGERFYYSNTNYVLLGMISERATGLPLHKLMRRWIFSPLGMDETKLPRRRNARLPRPFSHGYNYGTNSELNNAYLAALAGDVGDARITRPPGAAPDFDSTFWNISYTWPDGGAISTVHDLEIWAKALSTGELLSAATQRARLEDPLGAGYGLGIEFAPFGGLRGHNGAVNGYQSFMGYEPRTRTRIVVLANLILGPNVYLGEGLPADEMAKVIAAEVLP